MADFEAPSFSLGLDCDLFDSEPQIISVSEDDDYGTLIVDDSEPDYSDPPPKPKRLRRVLTTDVTTTSSLVSAKPKAELNSKPAVDGEDFDELCLQENRRTDEHLHAQNTALSTSSKLLNPSGALTSQPGKKSQSVGHRRRLLLTVSDSDSDDPSVSDHVNNSKCNRSKSIDLSTTEGPSEDFRSEKNSLDYDDSLPPAFRYYFHDDLRIQELVQSRLPNFHPLCNISNKYLEHPSTSDIDYMGQFNCGASSKHDSRNLKNKKRSSSSKISRKEKIEEETSQGWVNPKLCVDEKITKVAPKRNFHSVLKSKGYWLTGADGKRVYVGKKGQELTGRVAYMQYKKESGTGFKKAKRKFASKKKK